MNRDIKFLIAIGFEMVTFTITALNIKTKAISVIYTNDDFIAVY
jgi:hypothetical protein